MKAFSDAFKKKICQLPIKGDCILQKINIDVVRKENQRAFVNNGIGYEIDSKLLYENAKKYPCYVTYQNYGVNLCADGNKLRGIRNRIDFYKGCRYLLRSYKLKASYRNCMILGYFSFLEGNYKKSMLYYKKAVSCKYTAEGAYNLVAILYILKDYDKCCMLCEYAIKKYKDGLLKSQNIRSIYSTESLLFTLNLFSYVNLKKNIFSIYSFESIKNNCTWEAGFLLAYQLKKYAVGILFIKELLSLNYIVLFSHAEIAIIIEIVLKCNDINILKQILEKYSDNYKDLKRLIDDIKYRKQVISHYCWLPQVAEIDYYIM